MGIWVNGSIIPILLCITRHASACHYEISKVIYAQLIVRIDIIYLITASLPVLFSAPNSITYTYTPLATSAFTALSRYHIF